MESKEYFDKVMQGYNQNRKGSKSDWQCQRFR